MPINKTLNQIQALLETFEQRLNDAHTNGKSLPTTGFAKEMAEQIGCEWPQIYHIINVYLKNRPDLFIKNGPRGGVTFKSC